MTMKIGDIGESAMWLDGRETEEQLKRFKEVDIPEMFANTSKMMNVKFGPITFHVKRPGQDRVPQVPKEISGPDVRLLVAEAKVISEVTQYEVQTHTFINDLDPKDLFRLRVITRKAARKHGANLTNQQCDHIINTLGVEAALRTLRGESRLNS